MKNETTSSPNKATTETQVNLPMGISISSSAFSNGEKIPFKYSCDGANTPPPLSIKNVPSKTKSLTIIVEDPDAPSGTWSHFLIWNIAPNTTELNEGFGKEGTMGVNSSGKIAYLGPCPPKGPTHRYFFKVYALDSRLEIEKGSTKNILLEAMRGHILDQSEIFGTYSR
ncbi:MAG: YbhB/YbcL family Raf kinase inhibitor-like protein [bacterium]